jgi:hypothetical protein
MANIINATGIEVRSQINSQIPDYSELNIIPEIYHYYLRNTVMISTCEYTASEWANNAWNGGAGTISKEATVSRLNDTTIRAIVGNGTANGGVKMAKAMDLTRFQDGSDSGDSDYICFNLYIDSATTNYGNGIKIRFLCGDAPDVTNHYHYLAPVAALTPGWMHLKVQKSAFTQAGTANWSSVKGVDVIVDGTAGGDVEYIVNGIALIRKEAYANKPNVLQTPKDGEWSNDFNINSGEWWIFIDNNSNIVLRNVGSPAVESGKGTVQAALVSANQYKDFTINLHLCMPDKKMDYFQWQIDAENRVIFTYDGTSFQIIKDVAGVSTVVATAAATVAAGDNYWLKLTRNKTGFFLTAIRNNATYYALSCDITDFSADATGSLAIGEKIPTSVGSKAASIKLMEIGLSMKAETAFSALTAGNVTGSINGKVITDIFESDGVTAKKATLAGSCTGNAATATKLGGTTGGKWVELISGNVTILNGSAQDRVIATEASAHRFYMFDVYTPGSTVYHGFSGDSGASYAYFGRGYNGNDILTIFNRTTSSRTYYYKVWEWQA